MSCAQHNKSEHARVVRCPACTKANRGAAAGARSYMKATRQPCTHPWKPRLVCGCVGASAPRAAVRLAGGQVAGLQAADS